MVSLTCARRHCTQSTGAAQTINLRGKLFVSRQMAKLGLAENLMEGSRIEEHGLDLHKTMSMI